MSENSINTPLLCYILHTNSPNSKDIVEILKQYFSTTGKKLGKCFGSIVNTMGGKRAVYCLEMT